MSATRQRSKPIEHLSMNTLNVPADSLFFQLGKGRMTVDTPYQRGPVWTVDQQIGLIESLCMGVPIPAIIRNNRMGTNWAYTNGPAKTGDPGYAVIDGKQRLLTLLGQRSWDTRAVLPVAESMLPSVKEEARVYGLVNGAGTAQTAQDLARAATIAQKEN